MQQDPIDIQKLKLSDAEEFQKLVDAFGDKIYNTILGFVPNKEDAEDLCQEVFINIVLSIDEFRGDAKLSTWIYRIAVTKSLEFLRSRKTKKRFAFVQSLFTSDDSVMEWSIPDFNHPGIELEQKEQAEILFKAINTLPENQKTAFVLCKIEELSYTEISDVMKLSISSVESLIFRARQNLKKALTVYYKS